MQTISRRQSFPEMSRQMPAGIVSREAARDAVFEGNTVGDQSKIEELMEREKHLNELMKTMNNFQTQV
jgi:hypothetical protein